MEKDKKNRFESNKTYFTICIYALFVIAIGALIVYAIMNWPATIKSIQKFISTMAPFLVAFFIAFLLNPIVVNLDSFLQKKIFQEKAPRLRKGLAILISYLFVLTLITIALVYVSPQLSSSIQDITINRLPSMYTFIYDYFNNLETHYPNLDLELIKEKINEQIPQMISYGTNLLSNVFPVLINISFSIVKIIINVILSIVISCYLLTDQKLLSKNAKKLTYALFSKNKANYLCETAKECSHIFSSFIVGKTIDSLIIGFLCFILMSIFRFDYAVLISVIVGITNMIPYFGPFIGAIPGILIYLFVSPVQAVLFGILILVLQQFDGLYLGPKILGGSTGLKPLWVIFAITLGGAYFGPIGMFLGVPVVAVFSYLLNSFIQRRLKDKDLENME